MRRALALALVLGLGGPAAPALAASFVLDEAAVARAVALGQRSVASEAPFDTEWRVTNAAGETLTVMTPFHRVVVAARHAAFKNEALRPGERDKILRDDKDRLVVWAQLKGARADFARFYTPRLEIADTAGEREIEPAFVQNERSAARQDGGTFLARCVYGFPTKEIPATARLTLVIRDAEGRVVSRFTVDLAAMR